jgi:hypothetical protein
VTSKFAWLLDLATMMQGGYQIENDELTVDEWKALGIIQQEREVALATAGGVRLGSSKSPKKKD